MDRSVDDKPRLSHDFISKLVPANLSRGGCLLMFSGGRDSTLGAVRLHRAGWPLVLVTISSSHLVGMGSVRRRLSELVGVLPPGTPWMNLKQPDELLTDTSFYRRTCLPCHHAYVVASASVAMLSGIRNLAFGYAGYQSSWPEQTPLATERLAVVLARHGISLNLPVYGLKSREEAMHELDSIGLSPESLEQKCLQQINNVSLPIEQLTQQVGLWEAAIETSLVSLAGIEIEVLDYATLASLDSSS